MHGTASRPSDAFKSSNDLRSSPVSAKSRALGGLSVQVQHAKDRVTADGATRPKSIGTRLVQVLTAATFRAKLEVRQANKAANRAMTDVIKSLRTGDEVALKAASAKFTSALAPLARPSGKGLTESDLRGIFLARAVAGSDEFLASLNERLDKLSDGALTDPVIGHLDFAVTAAILDRRAQPFEEEARVFDVDGRGFLDLIEASVEDLKELIHMGELADELDQASPDNQHLRDEIPGTQMTLSRLRSMVAFGKGAGHEVAKREAQFKALASPNSDAIKKMDVGTLKTLGDKVVDFLESTTDSKLRNEFLRLHEAVTTQIQVLEDKITEDVIGPIAKFDATKLTNVELITKRRAIVAVNKAPVALANAGIDSKAEIIRRKDLARVAFQDSLRKALSNTDARKASASSLDLTTKTQEAVAKFAQLGDTLTKKELTSWINDATNGAASGNKPPKLVSDLLDATFPAKPLPPAQASQGAKS